MSLVSQDSPIDSPMAAPVPRALATRDSAWRLFALGLAVLSAYAIAAELGFRLADAIRFVVVAGVLCTAISATVGVVTLCMAGCSRGLAFSFSGTNPKCRDSSG